MLRSLQIRNLAIVDSLELDFEPGMSVLSGETGAGKSILIDALGLVLGERGSQESVRTGAERAEISAEFDISNNPAARHWLLEAAMQDEEDPSLCMLRRVVSRDGRGRQTINGSACGVRELRELGDSLVEIHGQHANQTLTRKVAQRQILDGHGDHRKQLELVGQQAGRWLQIGNEITELSSYANDGGSRLEFLSFQIEELEQLQPRSGEIEMLEQELRSLSHGGEILEKGHAALARLYDGDGDTAHSLLAAARRDLQELARHDSSFEDIAGTLEAAEISAQEAANDLRDKLEGTELDPQRLEWVNNRLASLHTLARKHRIEDAELPDLLTRLQDEHDALSEADMRIAKLQAERADALQQYRESADSLTSNRTKSAASLAAAIQAHLQQLGMPEARLHIDVAPDADKPPSPNGQDQIEFQISANPGQPLQTLSKVASGGELSRVSLAIQLECARLVGVPTMIFDEVDAGIGGRVAEMVGRSLSQLAAQRQVLCVTHLPQVAAQSGHQYQVRKDVEKGQTFTRVAALSRPERVEELARMLGGMEITDQTRAHAEEMMKKAG